MPKIIATSDIHGAFPPIPECDIAIIAGDVCPNWDHSVRFQLGWLDTNFRSWLHSIPAKQIIGIAGNHDFVFEQWPEDVAKLRLPWIYLQDRAYSSTIFSGSSAISLNIWGTPWVPNLARWAFHDEDARLDSRLAKIPNDIDIIVSHGPPHMYCDFTAPQFGSVNAGFPGLNNTLARIKPKALICGHIHEGYGTYEHPTGTIIYNVAHNTENYDPINPPMVIEL